MSTPVPTEDQKEKNQPILALRDLSTLLRKDSSGGQSIAVRSNLKIEYFRGPVTKLDILSDGSFICLLGQKLVRYSREGQILAEFSPQIAPRNFLVRQNGEEIIVMDKEGIKVFMALKHDMKFLPMNQVNVNPIINLVQCVGLAEDQDGNLVTINVNTSGSEITEQGSSNIFIIDIKTGLLNRIIELKPLYEEVALFAKTSPAISRCEFITVKNGVFYVVGLYRHEL